MKRYFAAGSMLLCIGMVVGCGGTHFVPEPIYAGRLLSEWLDCGYEQAALALEQTGPSAAPVIFSKLRREHPKYGFRAKYRKLWRQAPQMIRGMMPAPKPASFDELRACSALLEIGPGVIPALAKGLQDANPGVRLASAWTLSCYRERGCNISLVMPLLIQARQDPNVEVRRRAAIALGT
jgi:HEAT repeat protein